MMAQYESYSPFYLIIRDYAIERQLTNTLRALDVVCEIFTDAAEDIDARYNNPGRHLAYIRHSMSVTHMLIDFHIPMESREEDMALAATLCHILPENFRSTDWEEELIHHYQLDPEVYEIVNLITREDGLPESQNKIFFEKIHKNKLALLIKLADRGNLTEQLYRIASWNAREYIRETRTYFFPMSIYAKEHYPEIAGTINIMTEKMKCHIEAAEILINRYEMRENQLVKDILELKEENSRIRMIISKLKSEKE